MRNRDEAHQAMRGRRAAGPQKSAKSGGLKTAEPSEISDQDLDKVSGGAVGPCEVKHLPQRDT
jgi:hypothetical protein